jgi:hypothetical protein
MTEADVEKLMGSPEYGGPAGGEKDYWSYPDHITISFRLGRVTTVSRRDPLD